MSDDVMWALVAGFLSATFVLPVIQQPRWSARTRAAVTFGWCVLVGAGTAYLTGAFDDVGDVREVVGVVLGVFVSAIATYKGFARPTGIAGAIENATSSGGRHRAPDHSS